MRQPLLRVSLLLPATAFLVAGLFLSASPAKPDGATTPRPADSGEFTARAIESGWQLQSSAKSTGGGEAISHAGYNGGGWYRISRPETVLAGLVENGVYPDPTIGKNLRQIPGTTYPIGINFSNREMPDDSPFRPAWWYRVEFPLPPGRAPSSPNDRTWLYLDGVNYRANVWLNGQRIATSGEIAGAYVMHELEVTAAARLGEPNALALEIFPPRPNDLAITFVDWNPLPPDKLMGLWRGVRIRQTGPVAIRHPQVVSKLDLPHADAQPPGSGARAHLTITAELENGADHGVSGVLEGWIEGLHLRQRVDLKAGEQSLVTFAPESFSALHLENPRLWWPYQMGAPELYELKLEFTVLPDLAHPSTPRQLSDSQRVSFGISQITSELTPDGYRLFRVNGRKLLVRGAAWTPDILERHSRDRLETDFRYLRDMNLNTVRLEGKMDEDDFFSLADHMGILVLPGWCCCDAWQKTAQWDAETRRIAAASLSSQLLRLRNHPSVLAWLNGSDEAPAPEVERIYLDIEKKLDWPRPVVSAASNRHTDLSGSSGVKMEGPYDYVPPVYWYTDTKHGGAFGFATEISQGPAIPQIESLRRFLPPEKLWPINDDWDFHSGGGSYKNIQRYTQDLAARYGPSAGLEDFVWISQASAYEGERAMFEAYGRNRSREFGTATGVIHWMLNNAWPSLIWNLYDFYQRPHGGYFGTKKACEPLHVQYSYDDQSVVVVNGRLQAAAGLRVHAEVFNVDLSSKYQKDAAVDVPADGVVSAFALPKLDGLTSTYFLRLLLQDSSGRLLSRNFYWLSTQPDKLDWSASNWVRTPLQSPADFTALASLPATQVEAGATFEGRGPRAMAHIRVTNRGSSLAFLLRLRLTRKKDGEELLPVLWEDNYFELFPGETREIRADLPPIAFPLNELAVQVTGWNVNRAR